MAENSRYILAITCIIAIFVIVFFVNNYLHKPQMIPQDIQAMNSVGGAIAVVNVDNGNQVSTPIKTINTAPACSIAYVRSQYPAGTCPE